MNPSIRFAYFDIGGVLLRWREMMEAIAIKYGRKRIDIETVYFRYDALACRGELTIQDAWNKVCQDLQITDLEQIDFLAFAVEQFTPITQTHQLIRDVAQHYPVGLLTNIHHGTYELSRQKGLVPDIAYHVVVKSCDIGLIKPDQEIYDYAQKQAGVPHTQIFFTDDVIENIQTANGLGWHTVQFQTDTPDVSIQEIRTLLHV